MDLSQLGSGGGKYNRLAAGNLIAMSEINQAGGEYLNTLSVSNVNISSALTQLISVDVTAGQIFVIKTASIHLLNTTSSTLAIELEVDGVVVATSSKPALTSAAQQLIGNAGGGGVVVSAAGVTDIEVRSNFKVRAHKPSSTAVTFNVNFAKIKAA